MKKVVRSIAAVALMLVTATGFANEPKLRLAPDTKKSLIFEMNASPEMALVSITDTDGNVIYSENIEGDKAYSKKFDLHNLPEGIYILKVENDLKSTVFNVEVGDFSLRFSERKENTKPVFREVGQKVFLNLLNLSKEDVKITVFDSANRMVFSETISDTMLVEKAFNFEKAYDDTYMIVVKNGKDSFYEDVVVK